MNRECEDCPSSGDGCRPRDWKPLIARLLAVADGTLEGTGYVETPLQLLAACLAEAGGCPNHASVLLFPLTCSCEGLLNYLIRVRDRLQADAAIEELFRQDARH